MITNRFHWNLAHAAMALSTAIPLQAFAAQDQANSDEKGTVMLIMRGIPNSESPLGQLDDWAAVEYARRIGLHGEVLDVAGSSRADSPQVAMALDRGERLEARDREQPGRHLRTALEAPGLAPDVHEDVAH